MENIVVESHNGFAPVFYIIIAVIVAILVSIGFLIKKKNFNKNQLVKIFGKSLIVTLIINFLLFILMYFTTSSQCKPGGNCPSVLDDIFSILVYSIPFVLLFVTLINLIFKKRNNTQTV